MKTLTKTILKASGLGTNSPEFRAHWDHDLEIVAIEDQHWSLENMEGDLFNPEINGLSAAQNAREREAYRAKLAQYGVWGIGIARRGECLFETFIWGYEGECLAETALGEAKHYLQLMQLMIETSEVL